MKKSKNDCYACPHRGELRGSAHSECKVFSDKTFAFDFAVGVSSGEIKGIHDDEKDKPIINFDPHGVRNGWCAWPINFDPVWVDCYLPIESSDQ